MRVRLNFNSRTLAENALAQMTRALPEPAVVHGSAMGSRPPRTVPPTVLSVDDPDAGTGWHLVVESDDLSNYTAVVALAQSVEEL